MRDVNYQNGIITLSFRSLELKFNSVGCFDQKYAYTHRNKHCKTYARYRTNNSTITFLPIFSPNLILLWKRFQDPLHNTQADTVQDTRRKVPDL
jgi:hypothetical protein